MKEQERLNLVYKCRGLSAMLEGCKNGANIHAITSVKCALLMNERMLMRDDLSDETLASLAKNVKPLEERAKVVYNQWASTHCVCKDPSDPMPSCGIHGVYFARETG
jgi:hypothetical protein